MPSIAVGYLIAYLSFFPTIHRHRVIRRKDPDALQPEARLWWLLWGKFFHLHIPNDELDLTFLSGTLRDHWPIWIRMDEFRSTTRALDCSYDFLFPDRYCKRMSFLPTLIARTDF